MACLKIQGSNVHVGGGRSSNARCKIGMEGTDRAGSNTEVAGGCAQDRSKRNITKLAEPPTSYRFVLFRESERQSDRERIFLLWSTYICTSRAG